MSTKHSKNNPANREVKKSKHFCAFCKQERKNILYAPAKGKAKMSLQCSCGTYNKLGVLLNEIGSV